MEPDFKSLCIRKFYFMDEVVGEVETKYTVVTDEGHRLSSFRTYIEAERWIVQLLERQAAAGKQG